MRKIYISGPMRDNDFNTYKNYNYDAFDYAAELLRTEGFIAISPTDIDRLHEGWHKYPPTDFNPTSEVIKNFIRRDINILLEFTKEDAIYMLNGYQHSTGACVELAIAKMLDLEIIYQ